MIGTLLGNRYELLEKIGEGGTAEVYKAKCHLLNRFVSVKILKEEFLNDKEFVEKFKREATAAASLSDTNIVNIYDVGTQGNINYIVMEYVHGKTLKEIIIENGRLNYNKAIDMSIQIGRALECAHRNNIVHRDIKPHNILVTEDNMIKVTDFGIAKASNSVTITNTNKVMGSAHYFSPEQAKGSFVDNRTDIYSLGIVLYEMVTGKVPYDADSPVSVAIKHIQEQVVPPIEQNKDIPEGLNRVILKSIEKEPIKRYQNIKEMLLDLQKLKENSSYTIASNNMKNDFTRIMAPVNVEEEEEENEEKPKKNIKKGLLIAVTIILVILVGAVSGYVITSKQQKGGIMGSSKDIVVPQIVGLKQEDAKKLVEDKGLKFVVIGKEKSDKPEGTVVRCYPTEGTSVKANFEIRVSVSNGSSGLVVPNLKDIDLKSAKDIITNSELQLGNIEYAFNDTVPKDSIISQSPDPDSNATKDTKISLVVSKGPEVKYATVPDVKGKTLDEASNILNNAKLKLGTKTPIDTTDSSLNGKIANQSRGANSQANEGSAIDVTYYVYKDDKVQVPQFLGLTVAQAKSKASELGLVVVVNGTDNDIIETQDKQAGTSVTRGTTINLSVKANKRVVVPNFKDKTVQEAKQLAASLKLNLNVQGNQSGVIQGQSTAPEVLVDEGTTITVTAN